MPPTTTSQPRPHGLPKEAFSCSTRVEFSWVGDDDGEQTNGRGWAEIGKDGKLRGRLYFHQGDDSSFVAQRAK